jgi:ABC-type transport system involved in multi-copper enzyme maturation permease subunit
MMTKSLQSTENKKIEDIKINSKASLRVIFSLSFKQLFWSKKSILMFFIAAFPPALAVITIMIKKLGLGSVGLTNLGLFSVMMFFVFLQFLVLIVPLFYGTSLISDEIEQKTLTYLFTSPISKSIIILGKFLALIGISTLIIVISALITYFILIGQMGAYRLVEHLPTLFKDTGVLLLGIFCYGAFFSFLGARTKHPIIIGLLFSFGWESIISYIPGQVKRLTIMHYLQSIFPHQMWPSDVRGLLAIFHKATPFLPSLLTLIGICVGFVMLSLLTLYNKEYHLET